MTTKRVKFHGHVLGYGPGDVADVEDNEALQGAIDGKYAEVTTDQPTAQLTSEHPVDAQLAQPTQAGPDAGQAEADKAEKAAKAAKASG